MRQESANGPCSHAKSSTPGAKRGGAVVAAGGQRVGDAAPAGGREVVLRDPVVGAEDARDPAAQRVRREHRHPQRPRAEPVHGDLRAVGPAHDVGGLDAAHLPAADREALVAVAGQGAHAAVDPQRDPVAAVDRDAMPVDPHRDRRVGAREARLLGRLLAHLHLERPVGAAGEDELARGVEVEGHGVERDDVRVVVRSGRRPAHRRPRRRRRAARRRGRRSRTSGGRRTSASTAPRPPRGPRTGRRRCWRSPASSRWRACPADRCSGRRSRTTGSRGAPSPSHRR